MKTPAKIVVISVCLFASFLSGTWYASRNGGSQSASRGRKILYWHDPMHPAYKSDKPGIAPDCGMQLEPVYEDGLAAPSANPYMPPGTIQINQAKQQLIGVKVAPITKASGTQVVRILGRVAVDENRVHPIVAGIFGRVLHIYGGTTGSEVQKDQLLATFYSREADQTQTNYIAAIYARDHYDQVRQGTTGTPDRNALQSQVLFSEQNLLSLGISAQQIAEIARSQKATQEISLRSPMRGFVLTRNIFPDQRFDRGAELYRIVDLSRVWIVADVFRTEAQSIHPGMQARATSPEQGIAFKAVVADVPPQFDAASRTLKVRLEADNPGFTLRPDMFADLEFSIRMKPALAAPAEAILDTGLKKTVFVDRGNGYFEPRRVETGWRLGDRVEITAGLTEGERVVISSNFLMDSESRLSLAAAGLPQEYAMDPICGMGVNPRKADKKSMHNGKEYYFCSDLCKTKFDRNPEQYLSQAPASRSQKN